ncbi:unnamed protein product [Blepharisma stoltei]|uniref:Uncharacterized protein n=1 Tax=Blepharisma stoltei TaxID=1481888 RepID=A0AAU9I8P4_9CILI|nr:unnamed protein product [Blepharisma stoltei]CAG9319401.1 unnamed protein product [Blepharisma stoltei]
MILAILLIHIASCLLPVFIAISQYSSQNMINQIIDSFQSSALNFTELKVSKISQEDPLDSFMGESKIIIDVTCNLLLQVKLPEAAKLNSFVHIIVREPFEKFSDWDYFTLFPIQAHYEALNSFLLYFNWYQYNLIHSDSANAINLSSLFYRDINKKQDFCYSNDRNEDAANYFIGKEVKTTGLKNAVILNEGEGVKKLIRSLVKNKIYIKNAGIVL